MMNRVVFDIETLAIPFASFDETQQEYLLKFAKTEEEREETIQRLSLTPSPPKYWQSGCSTPIHTRAKYSSRGRPRIDVSR